MNKWRAQVVHMAKHMNMAGPHFWGALGTGLLDPSKSGAVALIASTRYLELILTLTKLNEQASETFPRF